MKKSKWLNYISMLALTVAVMVIGVYAAKLINLNSGGNVGYNPHNTLAVVDATISNAMRGKEYEFVPVTSGQSAVNPDWYDSFTTEDGVNGISEADYLTSTDTWNFGDIYFDDVNIEPNTLAKPVVFTFTITNYSDFAIKAEITEPTVANVTTVASNVSYIAPYNDETQTASSATVTLTFTLNDPATPVALTNIYPVLTLNRTTIEEGAIAATESGWWGYVDGEEFVLTSKPDSVSDTNIQVPTHIKFEDVIYPTKVMSTTNGWEGSVDATTNLFKITGLTSELQTKSHIVIPAILESGGKIYAVNKIGNLSFGICSVEIASGITSIDGSFSGDVYKVIIPETISNIYINYDYATGLFTSCQYLVQIVDKTGSYNNSKLGIYSPSEHLELVQNESELKNIVINSEKVLAIDVYNEETDNYERWLLKYKDSSDTEITADELSGLNVVAVSLLPYSVTSIHFPESVYTIIGISEYTGDFDSRYNVEKIFIDNISVAAIINPIIDISYGVGVKLVYIPKGSTPSSTLSNQYIKKTTTQGEYEILDNYDLYLCGYYDHTVEI